MFETQIGKKLFEELLSVVIFWLSCDLIAQRVGGAAAMLIVDAQSHLPIIKLFSERAGLARSMTTVEVSFN